MTARILIQFAHPSPSSSRVNTALRHAVAELEDVYVNDLYERYPELHIDVEREQSLLASSELLVFMHPMYWYSSPAILKEWQDCVLAFGFAYGRNGTALHGKSFLSVVTTGGDKAGYDGNATHGANAETLLIPFTQTARFCGMTPLTPHLVHDTNAISDERIGAEADRLRERLTDWLHTEA